VYVVFPEAGLLNERLMLSSSFRCNQIYKYEIHHFGYTLLCYLSRTWMFNEPASRLCVLKYRTYALYSLVLLVSSTIIRF